MKKNMFLLILPIITLLLEILPYGAVLNYANPEGEPWRETYSYFSPVPFGYGNFAPFITASITCIILLVLVIYCITNKGELLKVARLLLCVGTVVSLAPLMLGIQFFSVVGFFVTLSLVVELLMLWKKERNL